MRLNAEFVRDLWTPALLSGEYAQGKRALRSADDEYCCLGVAVDVAIKAGLYDGHWGRDTAESLPFSAPEDVDEWPWKAVGAGDGEEVEENDQVLPEELARQIGIARSGHFNADKFDAPIGAVVVGGTEYECLAAANDRGQGFAAIAQALLDELARQEAATAAEASS